MIPVTNIKSGGRGLFRRIKYAIYHLEPIYRFDLRYRRTSFSPTPLSDRPVNTTLKSKEEYVQAQSKLQELGLHHHPDPPKNWDHLAALSSIIKNSTESASILDAGGSKHSPLVEWLYLYGYRNLNVMNISFTGNAHRGPINYKKGDITNTEFPNDSFDFITSLSVIEHGVDVELFMEECARLLKPGGCLILSTDYWKEPLDSESVEAFGMPWNPFTPDKINTLVDTAKSYGFSISSEVDLTTEERVVSWRGKSFTFVLLEFKI
jgi:SAM-dependent methyltransferase